MNSEKELEIIKNSYSDCNDYYTPKGYVFCYDEFGKLLFHTHNMIVKSGRQKIFDALTGGSLNLRSLTAILGNSTDLVSSDDTKESLGSNPITIDSQYNVHGNNNGSYIRYESDPTNNLIYKYTIVYKNSSNSGSGIQFISTLALAFGSGDNDLFSRVVFPEYSANANLTFTYYLYF